MFALYLRNPDPSKEAGMLNKRCTKCGIEKDAAQFSPQKGAKHGLHSWCKPCCADYQRARRLARNASPPAASCFPDDSLPNILNIPIRPNLVVRVANIPVDLTKAEADRIERIVMAFADDPCGGECL
jgi:hypothetical protein